jgi:hypothetical protein
VEFIDQLLVRNGVWLPLAVMFVVRGALTVIDLAGPRWPAVLGVVPDPADAGPRRSPLHDLYARIITMQFTIILGGWLAIAFDNQATVMLLVVVKILIDLFYDPFARSRRAAARPARTVSKAAPPP